MPQISDDLAEPPEGSDGGLCVFGPLDADWRARFVPRTKRDSVPCGGVEAWSHCLTPMHEATPPKARAAAGWAAIEARTVGLGMISGVRRIDWYPHGVGGAAMREINELPGGIPSPQESGIMPSGMTPLMRWGACATG